MNKISILVLIALFSFRAFSGIKVATYNIKTFDTKSSPTNKVELKKIIKSLKADIITVEEIVNGPSFLKFIKKEFKNYAVHLSRCGGAGRQKIGFVYRSDKFKLKKAYEDKRLSDLGNIVGQYGCGRLRPALVGIFSTIKTKEEFAVIGLHLKAGGRASNYKKRAKQYKIVSRIVEELKLADYNNILLMGDFNSTGFIATDDDYSNFKDMLKDTNMNTSSGNLKCTSYWAGTNRSDGIEESSVLDHVLYPKKFLKFKKSKIELHSHCKRSKCEFTGSTELGTSYKEVSDHCPVSVTFK